MPDLPARGTTGLSGRSWTEIAVAHFDAEIAPTLGDLPSDGMTFLREQYVRDVLANPKALAQLSRWEDTHG